MREHAPLQGGFPGSIITISDSTCSPHSKTLFARTGARDHPQHRIGNNPPWLRLSAEIFRRALAMRGLLIILNPVFRLGDGSRPEVLSAWKAAASGRGGAAGEHRMLAYAVASAHASPSPGTGAWGAGYEQSVSPDRRHGDTLCGPRAAGFVLRTEYFVLAPRAGLPSYHRPRRLFPPFSRLSLRERRLSTDLRSWWSLGRQRGHNCVPHRKHLSTRTANRLSRPGERLAAWAVYQRRVPRSNGSPCVVNRETPFAQR